VTDSVADLNDQIRLRLEREVQLARPVIRVGRLALDTGRMEADAGHGPVRLTRLEFLLLKELVSYPGRAVPRTALLATVWGLDFDPNSNIIDVCVRRLRSKLGFELIKTVRGEGYQLLAGLSRSAGRGRPRSLVGRLARDELARRFSNGRAQARPGLPVRGVFR
jgi:DNA-binding response OmpR family regulator